MSALAQLFADIDARVRAIRDAHPEWLCRKGCDSCCKRLAEIPRLTAEEWRLVRDGLATLPLERLREIRRDMLALARQPSGGFVCPLLDPSSGACSIYAQRPVACRTYGFYLQRDRGLYCGDIESLVAADRLADVVWGNHDAVDQRLAKLGESRELTQWFAHWESAT